MFSRQNGTTILVPNSPICLVSFQSVMNCACATASELGIDMFCSSLIIHWQSGTNLFPPILLNLRMLCPNMIEVPLLGDASTRLLDRTKWDLMRDARGKTIFPTPQLPLFPEPLSEPPVFHSKNQKLCL